MSYDLERIVPEIEIELKESGLDFTMDLETCLKRTRIE